MSSRKRSVDHLDSALPSKGAKSQKLFPIFSKQDPAQPEAALHSFRWIEPSLGHNRSCLHGVNLSPKASPKVAAFDLDGCLIQSNFREKTKGLPPSFKWWRPVVPQRLKKLHEEGYSIIIVTNQALRGNNAIPEWKKKIPVIAASLPHVPFRLFAATAKDGYRKPIPGIWYEIQRIFGEEEVVIDMNASLFVGDAAGRKGDHSSTDRKWALNIGIPFSTPEEFFLHLPPADYTLPGFNVASLPSHLPTVTPTATSILPESGSSAEIVLFVGYPALGKSSFYRKHFEQAGYVHVNQDTLKTREKCVQAAGEAIGAGQSCVVDNTNRDIATRKHYVTLAKKFRVPIRCFLFNGSKDFAWHNNLYRAYNLPDHVASKAPKRDLLPYAAFSGFATNYEEPSLSEGFAEIKQVNWVFEGDEEERRRWSMWLQIDGK